MYLGRKLMVSGPRFSDVIAARRCRRVVGYCGARRDEAVVCRRLHGMACGSPGGCARCTSLRRREVEPHALEAQVPGSDRDLVRLEGLHASVVDLWIGDEMLGGSAPHLCS